MFHLSSAIPGSSSEAICDVKLVIFRTGVGTGVGRPWARHRMRFEFLLGRKFWFDGAQSLAACLSALGLQCANENPAWPELKTTVERQAHDKRVCAVAYATLQAGWPTRAEQTGVVRAECPLAIRWVKRHP